MPFVLAAVLLGLAPAKLFPEATFDPAVPTQEKVLGFLPGDRPMRHEELIRYLEALDAASDRATLVEYARTWEGRPLVYLAVGDPADVSDLDGFRARHASLPEDGKAVAWIAYGIHGDEISSTDAAAAVAYRLVAGEDELSRKIRRETLVLIDPCENPDGRERYLAQIRSFAHLRPTPDDSDLSHAAIWPFGRGNHFLFDLNRDWFTMVHPESARSTAIASWAPQLVVDSHEMGNDDSYLFSPPRHPFNPFLPPGNEVQRDRYAADQAKALDARGYPYYTREWNEEFFPGYGSSWAEYLGAIGILYEMSGTDGTLVRKPAGDLRTFAQAVEHQTTSSMANLATLAGARKDALAYTAAARREAARLGREGPVRAYVLVPGRDPGRADALAALLRAQGIEVLRLASSSKASGLRGIEDGDVVSRELPAGSWMVPMDQPSGLLARTILDPHVPMKAEFLREEREHLERGKDSRLYDATAWSLPLLRDVETYWSAAKPAGDWRNDPVPERKGRVETPAGATFFGWVLDGTTDAGAFALGDLLEAGAKVRIAEKSFRVAGRDFAQGAVLVKREENGEGIGKSLDAIARERGVEILGVATAKAERGPDLGGNYFHPLVAPRIGVLTGPSVSPGSYGAIWRLLDVDARVRFAAVDASRIRGVDLARFNVLVFPPAFGPPATYRALLGKEGIERLKAWAEAGGTLVGIGSGAEFLADKEVALTKTRVRSQALDRFPSPVFGVPAETVDRGGPMRASGIEVAPPPPKPGETRPAPAKGPADPYDVAPVIGPGAKPFVQGVDLGTPWTAPPVDLASWVKPTLAPGSEKPTPEDLARADERLRRFHASGAVVRADLDDDVWLDWGMGAELPVFVRSDDALVAEPPVAVAARFADLDRLHLGGLLWPEAAGRLARTAYATREGLGRGQAILFLDEPVFRGWTLGTRRLLLNALFLGPGMGTDWSKPW